MKNKNMEDIAMIRSMMERSSRFISLSGWSGVMAGVYAFLAAGLACYFFKAQGIDYFAGNRFIYPDDLLLQLFLIAIVTLFLAVATGIYLTIRKSKSKGLKIWNSVARRLLVHLFVPLLAGGIFCIALYMHSGMAFIAPATLIFYGLALLNASKFTFNEIGYLGYAELIIGLIALFFLGYGLVFWTIGFGVLHIVYGISMQIKYH